MQNVILFPTLMEATDTIAKLQANKLQPNSYTFDSGLILITGMGMLQTTTSLMQIKGTIDSILSLGCAGALHQCSLFSIHNIRSTERLFPGGSMHAKRLFSKMYPKLTIADQGKHILCSEVSVNHKIDQQADLVDMESYCIAHFAMQNKVPLKMIRTVSDFADEDTPEEIQKNLNQVSQILADVALQELTTFCL